MSENLEQLKQEEAYQDIETIRERINQDKQERKQRREQRKEGTDWESVNRYLEGVERLEKQEAEKLHQEEENATGSQLEALKNELETIDEYRETPTEEPEYKYMIKKGWINANNFFVKLPYKKAKKILFENAKVHKVEIKPVYEEKGLFKSMFAYEAGGEERDIARFNESLEN